MGDILSPIEKASSGIDEQKAMKMVDKLRRNEMDFNDLLDQMDELKKDGPAFLGDEYDPRGGRQDER